MRYSKSSLAVLTVATIAFASGSQACRGPQAEQSTAKASPADAYTPPPEGTALLVASVHALGAP